MIATESTRFVLIFLIKMGLTLDKVHILLPSIETETTGLDFME